MKRKPEAKVGGFPAENVEIAIVWSRNLKGKAEEYAVRYLAFMVGLGEMPEMPGSMSFAKARGIRESVERFLAS
jgi:hypothetical protein